MGIDRVECHETGEQRNTESEPEGFTYGSFWNQMVRVTSG
jgi:hypothetical protein